MDAVEGQRLLQLESQYIAAVLNGLNGVSLSAIEAEMTEATALFESYTPEYIATKKGKNGKELRADFIRLAGTLAAYNEGDIGPGHCDEDRHSA